MISRENFILFTPMLHEVASGDLFFAGDIEQMSTLRDVEAPNDMAHRIRKRRTQSTPNTASSPPEAGIRDQLN